MYTLGLILLSVVLGVGGQLLLKKGMDNVGQIGVSDLLSRRLPSIVGEKFVFLGLAAYLISAALWLVVLSREELSFAYPLIGIGYIFVAILAYFLFGEALTILRLLGIILIVAGAYLILLRV